jgi:hypothetical protein
MTGGDQREPLWASSLADQPRPNHDDGVVRVLDDPKEIPPPPGDLQRVRRRRLILGVVAAIGLVALLISVRSTSEGRRWLTIQDVPSYWGDIPMMCHTVRLEQDERAVEWFWCRAVGGRRLPPGLYRSPDSQWTSDITRRPARQSRVRISRDGEVVGWATY